MNSLFDKTYLVSVSMYLIIYGFFRFFIHLHSFKYWVSKGFNIIWEKRCRTFTPAPSGFSFPRSEIVKQIIICMITNRQNLFKKCIY